MFRWSSAGHPPPLLIAPDGAATFLERYPTPASAARLTQTRLASFLTKAGFSGRRPASELLARLTAAPANPQPHLTLLQTLR